MKLPKTKKEYDKDLENMDNFIDNIESYPPPKSVKWGIDYGYKFPPLYTKNPRSTFIGGLVIGWLIGFLASLLGIVVYFEFIR